MRNIRLEIEYDGTNYYGWQIQRSKVKGQRLKVNSIQETIEKALSRILQEEIKLIASGRTDAGVHAVAQIANFKTASGISLTNLKNGLNSILPKDIFVRHVNEADLEFHSRFNAKSKLYRYIILNRDHPAPFLRNYVYFCPYLLNINSMREEADCLIGKHDFKAFCASSGSGKDTQRTIKKIIIKKHSFNLLPSTFYQKAISLIVIDIEADGFLYNMARNIVGTLIDVGRGRLPKHSCKKILLSKNRRLAGPTAPAKGLYLLKVKYK